MIDQEDHINIPPKWRQNMTVILDQALVMLALCDSEKTV